VEGSKVGITEGTLEGNKVVGFDVGRRVEGTKVGVVVGFRVVGKSVEYDGKIVGKEVG